MSSATRATTMFAADWAIDFLSGIANTRIPGFERLPLWARHAIVGLGGAFILKARIMPRAIRGLARPVQDMAVLRSLYSVTRGFVPAGGTVARQIGLAGSYYESDYRGEHSMGDWMRSGLNGLGSYETTESMTGVPAWAGAYRMN